MTSKVKVEVFFNFDKGFGQAIESRYVGPVLNDRRRRYKQNDDNKENFRIDRGDVREAMTDAVFKVLERSL